MDTFAWYYISSPKKLSCLKHCWGFETSSFKGVNGIGRLPFYPRMEKTKITSRKLWLQNIETINNVQMLFRYWRSVLQLIYSSSNTQIFRVFMSIIILEQHYCKTQNVPTVDTSKCFTHSLEISIHPLRLTARRDFVIFLIVKQLNTVLRIRLYKNLSTNCSSQIFCSYEKTKKQHPSTNCNWLRTVASAVAAM
jgi:hypothetical protein